jgi:hypothetical protein
MNVSRAYDAAPAGIGRRRSTQGRARTPALEARLSGPLASARLCVRPRPLRLLHRHRATRRKPPLPPSPRSRPSLSRIVLLLGPPLALSRQPLPVVDAERAPLGAADERLQEVGSSTIHNASWVRRTEIATPFFAIFPKRKIA